jgi:hypothetical protein
MAQGFPRDAGSAKVSGALAGPARLHSLRYSAARFSWMNPVIGRVIVSPTVTIQPATGRTESIGEPSR